MSVEWQFLCLWNDGSGVCGTTVLVSVEWQFLYLWNDGSSVCVTTVKGTLKKLVFVDFFRGAGEF